MMGLLHDMRDKFALLPIFLLVCLSACSGRMDAAKNSSMLSPTPQTTPLAKIALKPDAELEKQIADIARDAKGKVGVTSVLLETGDTAGLNANQHYPMQSVYKLPISMAVTDQIDRGRHNLDEKITVMKTDFVRKGQRSPLRDENPNGGEFTIRELMRLALVESDGTASDVLLRILGGPLEAQAYLTKIGIHDIKIVSYEREIGGTDWDIQYKNWATPTAAVELLRILYERQKSEPTSNSQPTNSEPNGQTHARLLLQFMADSMPGARRLKGLLPPGTPIAHKTGTSGARNNIESATNDIGIITLPNGNHIVIAVLVSDSPANEKTREGVIAKIAKAVWDRWAN